MSAKKILVDIGKNTFVSSESMKKTPIQQAIEKAGGQTALARAIGFPNVKQQHVFHWLKRGVVPAEYVLAIEAATGVSRHHLRPDIYPLEG